MAAKKDTRGNSIREGFVRKEESNLFLEIKFMPEIFKNHLGDTEPSSVLGRNGSRSPSWAWSFLRERFFFKLMFQVYGFSPGVLQGPGICNSEAKAALLRQHFPPGVTQSLTTWRACC